MNLITLIFKLLLKFNLTEAEDYPKIKAEGEIWYSDIPFDEDSIEKESDPKRKLLMRAKRIGEFWFVRVALAFVYLWLIQVIFKLLNPTRDEGRRDMHDGYDY